MCPETLARWTFYKSDKYIIEASHSISPKGEGRSHSNLHWSQGPPFWVNAGERRDRGQEKLTGVGWMQQAGPSIYPLMERKSVYSVRSHMMGTDGPETGNITGLPERQSTPAWAGPSMQEGGLLTMSLIGAAVSELSLNSLGKCFCQHNNKALLRGTSQSSCRQAEPRGNPRVSLLKRYKASLAQRGFAMLPVQPWGQEPCFRIWDSLRFHRSPNYKASSLVGAWLASHSSKNTSDNQTAPTGFSIGEKHAVLAVCLFKGSK